MQEFILQNLVTIIFLVAVVYGFMKGFSSGFLKMLLSFGSIVLTIIATRTFTPVLASTIKDVTNIESSLTSIIYDAIINTNLYDSINIPWLSSLDTGNIESTIRDSLCTNIANGVINLMCGIVIFIVSLIIIRIVLRLLDVVNYIPLISQFNRILGGVLGVIQVILIIAILFTVLRVFESIPQISEITTYIKNSPIVNYIYENNVVYEFLSNLFTGITTGAK